MGQNLQFLELEPQYFCSTDKDFKVGVYDCMPHKTSKLPGFCDEPGVYKKVNYDI